MSGCFASGGPEWLFSIALGGGMAGALGLATALGPHLLMDPSAAGRPHRSGWERAFPLFLLPLLFVGIARTGGLPLSTWLLLILPLGLVGVAGVIDRRARRTASERELPALRKRTWSFAFGCLALAAALAAVAAMIVQGHPC